MIKSILLISFVTLIISFWNRDKLPSKEDVHPQMAKEPVQQMIDHQEFLVNIDDYDYFIQPQYDYELYGMVVSYRLHNSDTGAHLRWGDHLNVADLCVVWSENAFEARLNEMEFRNQEWTCYYQWPNREVRSSFNSSKLSNNHLITEDSGLRQSIKKIGIGDQIRIKGWLSSYRSNEKSIRGTSITRSDTGNGACETIYVNEVEVLNSHASTWRILMYFSLTIFLAALVRYFYSPYKPYL